MVENNNISNHLETPNDDFGYEARIKEMQKIIHDPNYEERIKELNTILEISHLVGSVMELDDILSAIVNIAANHMKVNVCSIYLLNENKDELILRASHGLNPDVVGKSKFKIGEGIQGIVAKTGEPIEIPDCSQDPRFIPMKGSNEDLCHAFLCIPLRIQEEIIGVMTARKHEIYQFTVAERTFFEAIAKQVAIVIEKSRLYFSKIDAERMAAISISLSEIAHYIKNLLQGIKGGAYFLETGLNRNDIEKSREGWRILRKSNKKIAYLVENMLNFSRNIKANLYPTDINEITIELLHSIEDTAHERGIDIQANLDSHIPEVMLDSNRIYDVLLNLVTNSVDAIPEGKPGTICISTKYEKSSNEIIITISDTGDGIPPEVLPKIFNLFFSTKGSRGTGIGLAVSKRIIEEHGGNIKVETEIGKGTTFTIKIPCKS